MHVTKALYRTVKMPLAKVTEYTKTSMKTPKLKLMRGPGIGVTHEGIRNVQAVDHAI